MATENDGRASDYPKKPSIDITRAREDRLETAGELFGESTRTGAIDQSARHARATREELEDALEELEEEVLEELDQEVDRLPTGLFDVEVELSLEVLEP